MRCLVTVTSEQSRESFEFPNVDVEKNKDLPAIIDYNKFATSNEIHGRILSEGCNSIVYGLNIIFYWSLI